MESITSSTHAPRAPPSYHVVPCFDIPAKGGPLQLGIVVDDLLSLRPLNRGAICLIPDSLRYEPTHRPGFHQPFSRLRNEYCGIWPRELVLQEIGGGIQTSEVLLNERTAACDAIVTIYFDPDQKYINHSFSCDGVKDYFEGSGYEEDVYMITGLKIAKQLRFSTTTTETSSSSLSSSFTQETRLAEAENTQYTALGVEFGPGDIVVGFRARRYTFEAPSWNLLRKQKLKGHDYLVGAELHGVSDGAASDSDNEGSGAMSHYKECTDREDFGRKEIEQGTGEIWILV